MSFPIKFSWRIVGLWYLAFPVALFFFFWLRAPYNIIFTAITIGVGLKYSIELSQSQAKVRINYRYLILTLCISLFFAILSGAGGFVWQKPDWTKHNVVLNDLINYRWPVYYGASIYNENTTLVYYIAYYLPAALIGKLFGWRAGEMGLFFQTFLGLFIFAQLIGESIRFNTKKYFIFFLLSGADILGVFIFNNEPTHVLYIEYYASSLQFSSVMTQLMWVPQHALAGWIGAILAYKDFEESRILRTLPMYVAIAFLWSPFISLGLALAFAPFVISPKVKQYFNLYTISGAIMSVMILFYFKSQQHILSDQIRIYIISNKNILNNLGMMFGFLVLDLYIFMLFLIFVKEKMRTSEKKIAVWLFMILVLIAQVMYGLGSDFAMRTSIPALTLIFIFVLRYLNDVMHSKSLPAILILSLLVIGIATPLVEIRQSFQKTVNAVNEKPLYPMINAHLRYKEIHQLYFGDLTSTFGRYFGNYFLDRNR